MQTKTIKEELNNIINLLPEEKIIKLFDFAQSLNQKDSANKTNLDSYSLKLQQKALNRIWDSPEEDIYEL